MSFSPRPPPPLDRNDFRAIFSISIVTTVLALVFNSQTVAFVGIVSIYGAILRVAYQFGLGPIGYALLFTGVGVGTILISSQSEILWAPVLQVLPADVEMISVFCLMTLRFAILLVLPASCCWNSRRCDENRCWCRTGMPCVHAATWLEMLAIACCLPHTFNVADFGSSSKARRNR
jgi:hypothetical protein